MKKNNLVDFNRLLALASGVSLWMMTIIISAPKIQERMCEKLERSAESRLIRDTVPVVYSKKGDVIGGYYNPFSNVARVHFFCDTTGNAYGIQSVDALNKLMQFSDYHEIRHARNNIYILQMRSDRGAFIFAADEMSARMAEYLAMLCDMPSLPSGFVGIDIDYRVPMNFPMRDLCDNLVSFVLFELKESENYDDEYIKLSHQSRFYDVSGLLSDKSALNKLMTFRINGRNVNVLRKASPLVRRCAKEYIYSRNEAVY